MITEKGKEYIARNFGVNNCYALEEVVPCTVYTDGTPNKRVLDTSTILFVLVTEVAEKVKTPARLEPFTLDELKIANGITSSISMMDALDIETYCIPGAPPVTPPVPPGALTVIVNARGYTIKNQKDQATFTCVPTRRGADEYECRLWLGLKGPSGEVPKVRGSSCDNFEMVFFKLASSEQTHTNGFTSEWAVDEIKSSPCANLFRYTGTKKSITLTKKTVATVPPVTPPTVSIKDYEIVDPSVNCDSYNCEARLSIKNNSNSSTSVYARFDVDGAPKTKRSVYLLRGTTKPLSSRFNFAGISDGYHDLTIAVGKVVDTDTYTHRFLVGAPGIEPPPPSAESLSSAEFVSEIRRRGTIDLARISMIPQDTKWFRFAGQVVYRGAGGQRGIVLTNPGKSNMFAVFSKDERTVTQVEKDWAIARIEELPFKEPVTPPYTPPVTLPTEPPEALKAWIVANYGDGTRVTSDGGRKLHDAMMSNTLAAPYTKAEITEEVVIWAEDNPNWETKTICGWISAIGVTNLTEDHGRYVYDLAIGWTTLADRFYDVLSPKPSRLPAALATEDNGRGVYDYAIGWNTLANRFTGCDF